MRADRIKSVKKELQDLTISDDSLNFGKKRITLFVYASKQYVTYILQM